MQEEKGFAYTKKNFRDPKTIAAVVISIVLLLLALNYFNIFPLNFLNALPKFGQKGGIQSKGSIIVFSRHPGFSLLLNDIKALENYFSDHNIWGKTYNSKIQKDTTPLKSIIIELSDNKNQVVTVNGKSGNPIFAYSLFFNKESLTMTIYLSNKVLAGNDAGKIFGNAVGYIVTAMEGKIFPKGVFPDNKELKILFQVNRSSGKGVQMSKEEMQKIIDKYQPKTNK